MNMLSESFRVLKDGGKAIFMTPSYKHNSWGPFYLDHTHVTPFTRFSLMNAMEMVGFKKVSVFYFYQLPFVWKFRPFVIFPKLISMLPIPYWPMEDRKLPISINKFVRFSNEVMLVGIATK